jgi:hypothetical protein
MEDKFRIKIQMSLKYFLIYKIIQIKKNWFNNNFNQETLIFSDSNSCIRKDILEKENFSNEILLSEDYEWAYRVLTKAIR